VAEIAEAGISGVLKRDVTSNSITSSSLGWWYADDRLWRGRVRRSTRWTTAFVDLGMLYKVSRLLQLKANLRQE